MSPPRFPNPAYPAKDSKILYGDKELYARLADASKGEKGMRLVEDFEIPIRGGKAWIVKKGEGSIFIGLLNDFDVVEAIKLMALTSSSLLLLHPLYHYPCPTVDDTSQNCGFHRLNPP